MKAHQIRQSFLDFFESKKHQVVTSASLLPESPNLLFTNAGMNQFVPYFLGDQKAPFSSGRGHPKMHSGRWKTQRLGRCRLSTPTIIPSSRCSEIGLSVTTSKKKRSNGVGNYSWNVWKFPPERLYATVYKPEKGDPAEFDEEAHAIWSGYLRESRARSRRPRRHGKQEG